MANDAKRRAKQKQAKVEAYFKGYTELGALQEVCEKLGMKPGSSKSACKKNLAGIYINIYDYVAGRYGLCKNRQELRQRCQKIGFYPKKKAKSEALGTLLRVLC